MRRTCFVLGLALIAAACTPTQEGPAGSVGALAPRGQVVVAHPPGRRDAVEQVRREAAQRCPGGFVIRTLNTQEPSPTLFTDRVLTYEAVVDCNLRIADAGSRQRGRQSPSALGTI